MLQTIPIGQGSQNNTAIHRLSFNSPNKQSGVSALAERGISTKTIAISCFVIGD